MNNENLINELRKELAETKLELEKYTSVTPTLNMSQYYWGGNYLTIKKPENISAITVPAVSATPVYLRSAFKSYVYEYITSNDEMTFFFWMIAQSDVDFSPVYEAAFSLNGIPSDVYRSLETLWQADFEMFDGLQTAVVRCMTSGKSGFGYQPIQVFRADATATAPIDWNSTKHISSGCLSPGNFPFLNEAVFRFENASNILMRTSVDNRHIYEYTIDLYSSQVTTTTETYVYDDDWWW